MQDLNKQNKNGGNFKSEFKIEETPVYEIGKDGNVFNNNSKLHLKKRNVQVTKDYWNIIELWDDQYIVCDLNASGYFDRFEVDYEYVNVKFQFGVIKLKRNEKGKVIPFAEEIVVPIIYDRICKNNEDSLTAYSNGHLTYIDLNPKSPNYGKQIVPAVLDHACAFDLDYDGFAECSIDGITGYLPRKCNIQKQIDGSSLLTEEEVQYLLQKDYFLDDSSTSKFSRLTGQSEVLKRTR